MVIENGRKERNRNGKEEEKKWMKRKREANEGGKEE